MLEPLRMCEVGCGAMVWLAEGKVCCSCGPHILGPNEYWELLKLRI